MKDLFGGGFILAPIVIFAYNRPEHTKQTIEALSKNILADESDIYIFSDAAKDDKSIEKVNQVRNYIDSLLEKNYFKSINIKKSQINKGLAESVISGVSEIIKINKRVIVIEDDLISSQDFLQYMNDALDFYDNSDIWSISGFNLPIKIPASYKRDIYLSYRGCSWGWATWKDKWDKVDWNVSDYDEFKKNRKLRKNLNRGGRDMVNMLESQMNKRIDSWAIRWCYSQSKYNMMTVYPVISRIQNIGLDGTGTHGGINNRYNVDINNNVKKCVFDNQGLDKTIINRFRKHYLTLWKYYAIWIKKHLKYY